MKWPLSFPPLSPTSQRNDILETLYYQPARTENDGGRSLPSQQTHITPARGGVDFWRGSDQPEQEQYRASCIGEPPVCVVLDRTGCMFPTLHCLEVVWPA